MDGLAQKVAKDGELPMYQVVQPQYNLYDRDTFDGHLQEFSTAHGLGVVTYYSLASGFLTGKYRSTEDLGQSVRGQGVAKYLNPRGEAILLTLDKIAATHGARPAEIALAWIIAQKGITVPIASATSVSQLESLARAARLKLKDDELASLNSISD